MIVRRNNPTYFPFILCKHLSHVSLLTECKQWGYAYSHAHKAHIPH